MRISENFLFFSNLITEKGIFILLDAFSHLNKKHEVLIAGRKQGDYMVDITKADSIRKLLESIPSLDSIICVAGEAK